MKLPTLIAMLATLSASAQSVVVVQINARWNEENTRHDLEQLKNCEYQFGHLEDQHATVQASVSSVPLVVIYVGDQAVQQFAAGIDLRLTTSLAEIQTIVNRYKHELEILRN